MAWDIGADEYSTGGTTVSPADATHAHAADSATFPGSVPTGGWDIGADEYVGTGDATIGNASATHGHTADNVTLVPSGVNAPNNVTVTGVTTTTISYSWGDTNGGLKQYRTWWSDDAGDTWTPGDELATGSTSYTFYWLSPGTSYRVGVSAFDDTDESAIVSVATATDGEFNVNPAGATHGHTADQVTLVASNTVSPNDATHAHSADNVTLYETGDLNAPAQLAATGVGDTLVVTWDDTNGGVLPYRVYYLRIGVDSSYTLGKTTANGAETATLSWLVPGTSYSIRVVVYDNPDEGPPATITATTGTVANATARR